MISEHRTETFQIVGSTVGDSTSASTYSGVPYHLFLELQHQNLLAERINAFPDSASDVFRGSMNLKRSFAYRRRCRNPYWRYLPENIERMSSRLRPLAGSLPEHDAIVQFGVAGLLKSAALMISHVEISVGAAATMPVYAESYGFGDQRSKYLARAQEGEQAFLSECDLVWTNSAWTAATFENYDLPHDRIWVHPPVCNVSDPGPISRNFEHSHVLFVGKDWVRKGGPQLLEAFSILRKENPKARLTIIGCEPKISIDGVEVLGFLDKRKPSDAALIRKAYARATVFCMPSLWESTGLVYMEAGLYGLPLIMCEGQGRRAIFPDEISIHLKDSAASTIADRLVWMDRNPDKARRMGENAREFVLQNYTWPIFVDRLMSQISRLKGGGK